MGRRRFSAEEKRAFLQEAEHPNNSISSVARRHGLSPRLLFRWRRLAKRASVSLAAVAAGPAESEVKQLKARVRELERQLRKAALENEILKGAIEVGREKRTKLAVSLARKKVHAASMIARTLGVARSNLLVQVRRESGAPLALGPHGDRSYDDCRVGEGSNEREESAPSSH